MAITRSRGKLHGKQPKLNRADEPNWMGTLMV
jgi:hypothetical protein